MVWKRGDSQSRGYFKMKIFAPPHPISEGGVVRQIDADALTGTIGIDRLGFFDPTKTRCISSWAM